MITAESHPEATVIFSLDKSTEEADSTKASAAKMEKEYETLKDSTKAEEQNTGNNEEPKGKWGSFPSHFQIVSGTLPDSFWHQKAFQILRYSGWDPKRILWHS